MKAAKRPIILIIGLILVAPLLSACSSVRPYAGIGISGPGVRYGPVHMRTGVSIGFPLR
ncbi:MULTISPECIES: hypothetical protein [Methylocaldum]|jgi:hypothetical protein|uniref:hypothetical protein n=1 Tax=unclassified Methylocaldum TaxID=2622260 RepID=UPI0010E66ADF|nr:hypothetical protein [Methylocaldum sp. RMAD-M]MBP1151895.1 putative small secreted protein [Methylocaldum sp. RMAD-M]